MYYHNPFTSPLPRTTKTKHPWHSLPSPSLSERQFRLTGSAKDGNRHHQRTLACPFTPLQRSLLTHSPQVMAGPTPSVTSLSILSTSESKRSVPYFRPWTSSLTCLSDTSRKHARTPGRFRGRRSIRCHRTPGPESRKDHTISIQRPRPPFTPERYHR